ncbi:MAG: SPASM domain-containing protein [Desulfamplus sp.]|nr:SPASM domain-containing protein [Desulfamplus sp.]
MHNLHNTLLMQIWRSVTDQIAPLPRHAQVEITNICNLNCRMCFRHVLKLDVRHMEFEVFTRIVNCLENVPVLTLSGYGEALCHPRFFDAVAYAKARGHFTRTTSNGLMLGNNDAIPRLLDSGLDYIAFSIEELSGKNEVGHPNAKVLNYIPQLIDQRDKRNQKTPEVALQTIMFKDREQDVLDIIHWGEQVGADRVNVARFETTTLAEVKRPTEAEEQKLFRQFSNLRRRYRIQIDCLQDQVFSGFKGFLYKHFKSLLRMDHSCIRIRDFVYIGIDGKVRPCCALIKHPMGNILDENLTTIWGNERFEKFRKNYKKIPWCARCDFARLGQINSIYPDNE